MQRSATKVESARDAQPTSHEGRPLPACIAIDGPSAAGKSTVGARVARTLGYRFIDTGSMYRAFTCLALERGIDPQDEPALARLAEAATMTVQPGPTDAPEAGRIQVDGLDVTDRLREAEAGAAVSFVARGPAVRRALVRMQRELAREGRVVMAGRDIGTVVLPNAALKVYLDASVEERARRRYDDLRALGQNLTVEQVRQDLTRRDAIDSERAVSPLRPAEDAIVIHTDGLTLEEVVERILALVPCRS